LGQYGSALDFVSGGVINFGFAPGFELVLQGFAYVPNDASSPALSKFTDTGAFVKHAWRDGCLQGKGARGYRPSCEGGKNRGGGGGAVCS
jgi:hypothetical protein